MDFYPLLTGREALEDQPVPICFFKNDKYKLHILIGFSVSHLVPRTAILYTGRGKNLLSTKFLFPKVLEMVQPCILAHILVNANKCPLVSHGSVDLMGAVGSLRGRLSLLLINQSAMDCCVGTILIQNYFRAILPPTRTLLFYKNPRVVILSRHESTTALGLRQETTSVTVSRKFQLTKIIKISPVQHVLDKFVCG